MCCSLSQGPSGIWCDIDVVEFTYYGVPAIAPKEQIFTELVDGLRGMDACIGSGTQVNFMLFQVPLMFSLSVGFDEDCCNIVELYYSYSHSSKDIGFLEFLVPVFYCPSLLSETGA